MRHEPEGFSGHSAALWLDETVEEVDQSPAARKPLAACAAVIQVTEARDRAHQYMHTGMSVTMSGSYGR